MKTYNSNLSFNLDRRTTLATMVSLACGAVMGCGKKSPAGQIPLMVLNDYQTPLGTSLNLRSKLWNIETSKELSEEITLRQDEGLYAILEVELLPNQTLAPEVLVDPRIWSCIGVISPQGKKPSVANTVEFGFEPIFTDGGPFHGLVRSILNHSKSPAYRGPMIANSSVIAVQTLNPARDADGKPLKSAPKMPRFPPTVAAYWTYLGGIHHEPDDYTLDVRVFPCLNMLNKEPKILDSVSVARLNYKVLPSQD